MKLLTPPVKRTAQSGRNWFSASKRLLGNPMRTPLRSTSGADTLTVPGKPKGAEASIVMPDLKKKSDKIVMFPPLREVDLEIKPPLFMMKKSGLMMDRLPPLPSACAVRVPLSKYTIDGAVKVILPPPPGPACAVTVLFSERRISCPAST